MARGLAVFFTLFLTGLSASFAHAHEARPAFLKLSEVQAGQFDAVWKQPELGRGEEKVHPNFPAECEIGRGTRRIADGTLREDFSIACALRNGEIQFDGMDRTLTDVFTEISYLDGTRVSGLVKTAEPVLVLGALKDVGLTQYIMIGVEHILMGWDHLLFVMCLTMMVTRQQILGVATSFTLAHSLTLGLAVFGVIALPIRPIEILIAASIVLMATEVMRKMRGGTSLALRRPYLLGFFIGLIHGCGFASALGDIGLPKGVEFWALLLFNVGVELGQFLIIGLLLLVFALLRRVNRDSLRPVQIALTYGSAAMAMFWVLDRTKDYFI